VTVDRQRGVDVERVRREHPIQDVAAASGVELRPSGQGFVGCCPFHEDSTPSLSVGGVADRFHCFGCGAGSDVIDWAQRTAGVGFLDAVRLLDDRRDWSAAPVAPATARRPPEPPADVASCRRVLEVNALAWEHFTEAPRHGSAVAWLRDIRGIDVDPLERAAEGPVVGMADASWTEAVEALRRRGVSNGELLDADLAHRTRGGRLVDSYRSRVVVPVRDTAGRVTGFIGRDTTGDPAAPKYRNPTRTPGFDKSTALYRPAVLAVHPGATVVVVEGALDALSLAATAAAAGRADAFAPCTTSGVTVSAQQARAVLSLTAGLPVIALDGDPAGTDGTDRWVTRLCIEMRRPVLVTRLPSGVDPADWLAEHGRAGLSAFDPAAPDGSPILGVHPGLPDLELTRIALSRGTDAIRELARIVVPLLAELPPTETHRLVAGVEHAVAGASVAVSDVDRARIHAALTVAAQRPGVRALAAGWPASETSCEPPSYAPSLT
jgi:DNA primase